MVQQVNNLNTMRNDTRNGQSNSVSRVEEINNFKSYADMSESEIEARRKERNASRAGVNGATVKTYIPAEFKDPKLHYEWVMDDGIGVDMKKRDGWVLCENAELARKKGCSTGSVIKIPAGQDKDGHPIHLVLMAIHKRFYEDDMDARKNRIKEISNTIDGGSVIDSGGKVVADGAIKTREVSIS